MFRYARSMARLTASKCTRGSLSNPSRSVANVRSAVTMADRRSSALRVSSGSVPRLGARLGRVVRRLYGSERLRLPRTDAAHRTRRPRRALPSNPPPSRAHARAPPPPTPTPLVRSGLRVCAYPPSSAAVARRTPRPRRAASTNPMLLSAPSTRSISPKVPAEARRARPRVSGGEAAASVPLGVEAPRVDVRGAARRPRSRRPRGGPARATPPNQPRAGLHSGLRQSIFVAHVRSAREGGRPRGTRSIDATAADSVSPRRGAGAAWRRPAGMRRVGPPEGLQEPKREPASGRGVRRGWGSRRHRRHRDEAAAVHHRPESARAEARARGGETDGARRRDGAGTEARR